MVINPDRSPTIAGSCVREEPLVCAVPVGLNHASIVPVDVEKKVEVANNTLSNYLTTLNEEDLATIKKYSKLNEDELNLIGKWVGEYCDEGELLTVTTPVGLFPTYSYYMVMVQEINGKRVPWKLGSLLDDQDNLTSDDEIMKLLDKSNSKEPVTESLIKLQSLFDKTL